MRAYYLLTILWLAYLGATIIAIIQIWTEEIKLEMGDIPTLLNGLISSISMITGFTGTIIALMYRQFSEESGYVRFLLLFISLSLLFPIGSIERGYYTLFTKGDYEGVLKESLTGLFVALFILFSTIELFVFTALLRWSKSKGKSER